jgi:hypothetical protein
MTIDAIRLTDLADPQFSPEISAIRAGMATMAEGLDYDPDAMRALAIAEVGLEDFGGKEYEAPLAALTAAVDRSGILSPVGRIMLHAQLIQLLKNRLLLTDLLSRHPEIHDIEIGRPIIICGLPRSGTTHLHNLMAADSELRSLPYWESLEPIPLPAEVGADPDPRLQRCEMGLQFINQAMPHFKRMHEMTTWHVHEEIQLLAMEFSTMLFESFMVVPEWRDYYMAHDQTPHYRYMRTVLKALQFLRGGHRWVLKSPQHLEQFGPLFETFPDATFVVTHRDPVAMVTSMATMAAYTGRMYHDPVDPELFGSYWADRLERMLGACVRDRELLPADQSIDVRFNDFMRDDIAMVRRIYALADQPFTQQVEAAMATYMVEHPQGRHGRVDYRAADVGLHEAELVERFGFYTDRFLTD